MQRVQVSWHGERLNTQPEWGTGRFIGMMILGHHGHALFAAWNTKHEPCLIELPDRGGDRLWRLVADTGKPAPYDVLVADDQLNGAAAEAAGEAAAAWTRVGAYALLPWSCAIFEVVLKDDVAKVEGVERWDDLAVFTDTTESSEGVHRAPGARACRAWPVYHAALPWRY
jgi:hypothetical protein